MTKFEILIQQLEKAITRLKEVLKEPKTDIVRDSAIKRFEFSFDLTWKTLRAYLEEKKGIISNSPKDCFKEAYHQKIIEYDESWLKFVDLRNEIVHSYDENTAEEIYKELPNILKHIESLFNILTSSK
jgi:nucleotidyltransferase substrate binding protein (TIGR01987 family)